MSTSGAQILAERFSALISETGMQVEHMGGGCFALTLATTFHNRPDGTELIGTDTEGLLPENESGPWNLGEYEDGDLIHAHPDLSRADLVAHVLRIKSEHEAVQS